MPDRWRRALPLLIAAALANCAPVAPTSTDDTSLWGRVYHLADTEQAQAPALWVDPDGLVTAAWIGADERGVHHDARGLSETLLSDTITLPLPPVRPYAQQLLPASQEALHLLWLDLGADNQQHLFAARLQAGLVVERGPTVISERDTLHYTALPLNDGDVQVIWSGGLLAEPALYAQIISERGIPREAVLLLRDADWPALLRTHEGRLHLFWLKASDHTLQYGILNGQTISNIETVPNVIRLERGDRLHGLYPAVDLTHLYLFWHVTRRSGENETWLITRALNGGDWDQPRIIGVGAFSERALLQTGFNTGRVSAASEGENGLHWGVPMSGQFALLPVAGRVEDHLVIVYFQAGSIAGYQRLISLRTLIGPPTLFTDRDRYLYVAWSEPNDTGQAELKLTGSRG